MAHSVQDARAQQPIIGGLSQPECLDEIPLGMRAARRGVVAHPRGEQGGLGNRGEQGAADSLGVPAAQQPFAVGAEVLDQRLARVPAAKAVIKLSEQPHRRPEPLDIAHPDPNAAEGVSASARTRCRIDQPAQRRVIPRRRSNQPSPQHALVSQARWLVRYEIGGQQLTDYWFYVRHRWVFELVLSNPDAVRLYRMTPGQYAAAVGCNH